MHYAGVFVVSRVTLSSEGIRLFAVSESGDVVFDHTLGWVS